ncbi:MAG: hypothetical protein GY869_01070 [Planctomycetes bacterium]|nr:hypothetical protein [Planctomycetota bacterium]
MSGLLAPAVNFVVALLGGVGVRGFRGLLCKRDFLTVNGDFDMIIVADWNMYYFYACQW